MKRNRISIAAGLSILTTGLILSLFSSCEGPAGLPGQDASETCIQCHNNEVLVLAIMEQAANSGHQTGTSFERSGASCAPCHTHQGFLESLQTGASSTVADVSNPLPANCRTCHTIHENFDSTDFELRTTEPVKFWVNGETADLGNGNVCARCHQPRTPNPMPIVNGDNVTINSSRWGPHHGLQATMIATAFGFEIPGSVSYPSTHPHAGAGCNTCHMAEPFGTFAGGHSFSMDYEYHGATEEHLAGCQGCHPGAEEFDIAGASSEVQDLMAQLWQILLDKGYVSDASGLLAASSSKPLVIPANHAGAILNYYIVMEDGSNGVHNPKYAKALLQNSIEVFN